MRLELVFLLGTAFIVYNTYYEGKWWKYVLQHKKHIKIAGIIFAAFALYLMVKRRPGETRNLMLYASGYLKQVPVGKSTLNLFSPIFDMTSMGGAGGAGSFMDSCMFGREATAAGDGSDVPRSLLGLPQNVNVRGTRTTKRAVSETKKKYVAYMQDWKCAECGERLKHTFEVDHRVRLDQGGSNDADNLVALCRECHGQKTAMEVMNRR